MRRTRHSNAALVWLVLALPVCGCAQWTAGMNAFRESGEIRGQVEISAASNGSTQTQEPSGWSEQEVLVFLEPIPAEFSFRSLWEVQKVAIQTARQPSAIQLVMVDQPIRIQNLDAIHHEFFTTHSDNAMRVQLAGESDSTTFRLQSPGLVRLYCVLHPNESHTFIATSSSTYSAFVDAKMRFRIPNVRPGRYRVRAASALDWGQPRMIEIGSSETAELKLQLASGWMH